MKKKLFALFMAFAMILSMTALTGCGQEEETDSLADRTTFIMGIDPEYEPFSYVGDDGEYTGFDVEICKAACELIGWDFEVFGVNWDQKLIQLDNNECDCVWSGMTILDSMTEAGYVISDPYFENSQVLVVKEDSDIKTKDDLAGKIVSVQLGTSGESLLNGDLADWAGTFGDILTCDSFLKCFTELSGDSVDAVFVDAPVAEAYVAENEGFRIIDESLGFEQYGIAFRSEDQALCDKIEEAVAELVENGTYAEIAAKYPTIKTDNLIFLNK